MVASGQQDSVQASGGTDAAADPVAGKTAAEILGEIAWVMTQDPAHANAPLGLLESRVMPAIVLRQFHISYLRVEAPPKTGGAAVLQPVAVEIWAMVSEAVRERIETDPYTSLSIAEWYSGTEKRELLRAAIAVVNQ